MNVEKNSHGIQTEISKMIKLEKIADEKQIRCMFKECSERGEYMECVLHTYLIQPCFRKYYNNLNEEQKEILFHPEQFYF